jgi:hypothetical protein
MHGTTVENRDIFDIKVCVSIHLHLQLHEKKELYLKVCPLIQLSVGKTFEHAFQLCLPVR